MANPAAGQQDHLAKHHPNHVTALRPERHPDTDLAGPPRDVVRHHAAQANARDCESQESKGGA